ncbi:MAG: hypothetical protein ACI4ED_00770 [Suilimivivens sp.]
MVLFYFSYIFLGIKTIGELAEDLQPYMFAHEANKGYGNSLTAPQDSFKQKTLSSLQAVSMNGTLLKKKSPFLPFPS